MLFIVYRNDELKEDDSISKVIEERKSNPEEKETNNEAVKKNELENSEPGQNIASNDPETTKVKPEVNKSRSDRSQSVLLYKKDIVYCYHCCFSSRFY